MNILKTGSIILIFLLVAGCSKAGNKDPDAAKIVTEDIERFWQAFDAGINEDNFQNLYFDKATKGLESFIPNAIGDVEQLVAEVRSNTFFYRSAREQTLEVNKLEPEIRSAFRNLKDIYPKAIFPDVYFVIGRMSSGGKDYPSGLVIGTEKFVLNESTNLWELDKWRRDTLATMDEIPIVVSHELIHHQQPYINANPQTLLYQTLIEGNADFVAELISDAPLAQYAHDFANAREEELWLEFQQVMNGTDYSGWLYGLDNDSNRPSDLGYWMGYKIAEAYYDKATDKTRAVADIIEMKDAEAFLEASGYADKFR